MKRKDLKAGYILEDEGKILWLLINSKEGLLGTQIHVNMVLTTRNSFTVLEHLTTDLKNTNLGFNPKNIIKVYGLTSYAHLYFGTTDRPLLWERKPIKKMTVEQINKELGYEIEVIK